MNEKKDQKEALLRLVRDAVKKEVELREQYQIGEKFRFIRDRLKALLTRLEENLKEIKEGEEITETVMTEQEAPVYVYLFNAQGNLLKTWQKMLTPAVFYEYSINRPIYQEKSGIEAFIRSKENKTQHGYLTIAVSKENILPTTDSIKDAIGNVLIKVKEGALQFDRFISFTHNNIDYRLADNGELIPITSAEH